jgi:hypothetical protein
VSPSQDFLVSGGVLVTELEPGRLYARLVGKSEDVQTMARLLSGPDLHVVEDRGSYYLRLTQAEEHSLEARARDLVEAANGAYKAAFGRPIDVRVDGTLRFDLEGRRHFAVGLEAGVYVITGASIGAEIRTPEGVRIEVRPDDLLRSGIGTLVANPSLASAYQMFYRVGDTWKGLYQVLELLQAAGSDPVRQGYCKKSEMSRFRQTANSFEAVGVEARHAKPDFPAPNNPMSLREAKDLFQRILLQAISGAASSLGKTEEL